MASVESSSKGGLNALGVLAASVAALLVAWFLFGPRLSPKSTIQIPPATATRADLIEAAQQFHGYLPSNRDLPQAFALLSVLRERIPEPDWAAVQMPTFKAWEVLRVTPGAWEFFEAQSQDLLKRLAHHATPNQLEDLVSWAKRKDHLRERIDLALDHAAAHPFPTEGYEGSRLKAVVTASILADDAPRALALLTKFNPPGEEAQRLQQMLGLIDKSKPSDFPQIADTWAGASERPELRRVTVSAGARVANAGQETGDWAPLKQSMDATRSQFVSDAYWKAVAWAIAREAGGGVFMKEPALSLLVAGREHEAAFWEQVQEQTPRKNDSDSSWRAICWGKVIRSTSDPFRREVAFDKLLAEQLVHDPLRVRRTFEEYGPLLGNEATGRSWAKVEPALRRRESEIAAETTRIEKDREQAPLRGELTWLKSQLSQAKSMKGVETQVIANLERRIREIEGKLTR